MVLLSQSVLQQAYRGCVLLPLMQLMVASSQLLSAQSKLAELLHAAGDIYIVVTNTASLQRLMVLSSGLLEVSTTARAYRDCALMPIVQLMEASSAEKVHDLPLLPGPHARKHNHIAQHSLQDRQVFLLQHVLEGWPGYTALCLPLRQNSKS